MTFVERSGCSGRTPLTDVRLDIQTKMGRERFRRRPPTPAAPVFVAPPVAVAPPVPVAPPAPESVPTAPSPPAPESLGCEPVGIEQAPSNVHEPLEHWVPFLQSGMQTAKLFALSKVKQRLPVGHPPLLT
jgi:hypothetical protein